MSMYDSLYVAKSIVIPGYPETESRDFEIGEFKNNLDRYELTSGNELIQTADGSLRRGAYYKKHFVNYTGIIVLEYGYKESKESNKWVIFWWNLYFVNGKFVRVEVAENGFANG